MKAIQGLLAALAGGALGAVLFALGAVAIARALHASEREGALGYLGIAAGVLGFLLGSAAGISLVVRSVPEGERLRALGSIGLGVLGLVLLVALVLWGWVSLREDVVKYGDNQASLELEFRLPLDKVPPGAASSWLSVEVHTSKTRPAGTVLSSLREEEGFLVVPVTVTTLIRSSRRTVVASIEGRPTELFDPRLPAKPDPRKGFSAWRRADFLDRPGSDGPVRNAGEGLLEMRARVRLFGED